MYSFFMDLFERFQGFFTFFMVLAGLGLLSVLFLIAFVFYRIIAHRVTKRVTRESQGEIDRRQDEAIETISKETKKALALEDELNAIKNRLGEPKEG